MKTKKYELINYNQETNLYRIKALKDFNDVKSGDLGGFVDSENNLSHEGNCWIYDSAVVCDSAIVKDDAIVYGSAVVCDSARVYGSAVVCDSAVVRDSAIVRDSAVVCDSAIVCNFAVVCDSALVCNFASSL